MCRRAWLAPLLAASLALLSSSAGAAGEVVCTLLVEAATGQALVEEGACDTRAPAASTFKVAIGVMGFDAGILKSLHDPELPFREGYPDWIKSWRSSTDPEKWMRESVVWYSQQVTTRLGMERFAAYVRDFSYGNMDVSGDAGKDNGLTRSWLSSSLRISPREQVRFLDRLARRDLPASREAQELTRKLIDLGVQPSGWTVFGKTGTAAGETRWGWFVGWAEKGERRVVFARLVRSDVPPGTPLGPAARAAVLQEFFAQPESF